MLTLVKCIEIAFFLHSFILDSLKVFKFLVSLLYKIGKKVMGTLVKTFALLFMELMHSILLYSTFIGQIWSKYLKLSV